MVIDLDGPPCQGNCPNHGCLEPMASGTALAREARALAEANPLQPRPRADGSGASSTAAGHRVAHDGDAGAVGCSRSSAAASGSGSPTS